jgi:hypothetical protein
MKRVNSGPRRHADVAGGAGLAPLLGYLQGSCKEHLAGLGRQVVVRDRLFAPLAPITLVQEPVLAGVRHAVRRVGPKHGGPTASRQGRLCTDHLGCAGYTRPLVCAGHGALRHAQAILVRVA